MILGEMSCSFLSSSVGPSRGLDVPIAEGGSGNLMPSQCGLGHLLYGPQGSQYCQCVGNGMGGTYPGVSVPCGISCLYVGLEHRDPDVIDGLAGEKWCGKNTPSSSSLKNAGH